MKNYISPNWPAPKNIKAFTTTRENEFNLALHIDDDPRHVSNNRKRLRTELNLPAEPLWLSQTHSNIVINSQQYTTNREADSTYSNEINKACVVMTADCLPILICNKQGTEIAAIHAGWRGLNQDIIKNTVAAFKSKRTDLLVWLGPAIGPEKFEVGEDVKTAFTNKNKALSYAFKPIANEKYLCNIFNIAQTQLEALGIDAIYGGDFCTYSNKPLFYSYRREQNMGRMASLIWINA